VTPVETPLVLVSRVLSSQVRAPTSRLKSTPPSSRARLLPLTDLERPRLAPTLSPAWMPSWLNLATPSLKSPQVEASQEPCTSSPLTELVHTLPSLTPLVPVPSPPVPSSQSPSKSQVPRVTLLLPSNAPWLLALSSTWV
jgi:hypothetical protein